MFLPREKVLSALKPCNFVHSLGIQDGTLLIGAGEDVTEPYQNQEWDRGCVLAVNGKTSAVKWRQIVDSPIASRITSDSTGAYFVTEMGKLYAVNNP